MERRKEQKFFRHSFNNKFHKKQTFSDHIIANEAKDQTVGSITIAQKGQNVIITGIVERVVQTGGPTIFHVSDGTGILAIKGFEGAGVRAFAHIEEGDAVRATVSINEYNRELEGEISKFDKLSATEKEEIAKNIEEIARKRASIIPPAFLVKNKTLDKLKDSFVKAATEIRLAVFQNRPIVVRHHNDADGYSSGFALERAIVPLVAQQHGGGKSPWEYYTRSPCAAPMYEIEDSIKDTAHSLSDVAKFSNKMPLVVIADTGSGEEDLLGIQQGKIHGIDFIVIDHHVFEKDVISKEVLVHINPFLVGEDGAKYSAGMLCAELARFINPAVNIDYIPAMAGLADRINNKEVMDNYIKIAEKSGYTKTLLHDIAALIDFVSTKLRFMEAREYIEVVFGEPINKQKALVALMSPYIRALEEKGLSIAKTAAIVEKIRDVSVQMINIDEAFSRGVYPKPGKCTGLLHDSLQEKEGMKKVITLGIMQDVVTIRATDEAEFSVQELIKYISKKLPSSFVEGGGHKNAGSIKFVPRYKAEVLAAIKAFISEGKH